MDVEYFPVWIALSFAPVSAECLEPFEANKP